MAREQPSGINETDQIDVTFGAFHIGVYRVPYMSSVLRFQQVAEYLKLVTDDQRYVLQDWDVEELFQRDVDQNRVVDIADNYLNPDLAFRPPFFNSLTVVLTYNDEKVYSRPKVKQGCKEVPIGPITISYQKKDSSGDYPKNGSFGFLSWNRDQVHAVAIDGQHRLAALKHLWSEHEEAAKNSDISVIFLAISPEMGFMIPPGEEPFERLKYMRSIFVDLNKYAVPVSKARNILLDDRDPGARFVRQLFGKKLLYQPKKDVNEYGHVIGKDLEFSTCIPLNLVDWHSEAKSKVDEGPYITSVLSLDWVVDALLSARVPAARKFKLYDFDPDDENYYSQLEAVLKTWPKTWEEYFAEHLRECIETDSNFIITRGELDRMSEEFTELFGPVVTRVLTGIGPYKELVRMRVKAKTLSPEFGQWYQAKSAWIVNEKKPAAVRDHYEHKFNKVKAYLKTRKATSTVIFENVIKKIDAEIKKDSLFFFIVGQRAIFYALIKMIEQELAPEWAHAVDKDIGEFSNCVNDFYAWFLVEAINNYYEVTPKMNGLFSKQVNIKRTKKNELEGIDRSFWAGSLVKRENPDEMDYSLAAARRGGVWFKLMVILHWFVKANDGVEKKLVLGAIKNPSSIAECVLGSELNAGIGEVMGNFGASYSTAPMAFLAGVLPEVRESRDKTIIEMLTRERLAYLCETLGI